MRCKKLKRTKKITQHLIKKHYRTPFRVILTPQFLCKLNKQKICYSHFTSILSAPKLYITSCSYKFYKGLHKHESKEKLKAFTNNEKKKWKKTRFLHDFIKHCTIKRCEHDSGEHASCTIEMARTKKYILGMEERNEDLCDVPVIVLKNSELNMEMQINE